MGTSESSTFRSDREMCDEVARMTVRDGELASTGISRGVYAALLREGGWPETAAALDAVTAARRVNDSQSSE